MKILIGVAVAALILIGAFFVLNDYMYQEKQGAPILETEQQSAQDSQAERTDAQMKPASKAPFSGSMTYGVYNWADPAAHRFEMIIQYKADCNLYAGLTIDTGDGHMYPADCGSVLEHKYPKEGQYTVRYLYGDEEIVRTVVEVK